MNKVILIGNLTKNPELSQTPSGIAVCKFSIAVARDYANADGNRETDFFNISVWRGRAESCGEYLKKGNKVAIWGSIQNRSYEDKDGIKRTITEIVANDVEFLTPKKNEEPDEAETVTVSAKRERLPLEPVDDNSLPF